MIRGRCPGDTPCPLKQLSPAKNVQYIVDCLAREGAKLVEMFNCIVDTVEDSSSVRSYRKFLIANFCYKYIHKTIKLIEYCNT